MTKKLVALFAAVAASALLVTACGGGGAGHDVVPPTPSPPPPPGAARGTLVVDPNAPAPTTLAKSAIDSYNSDESAGPTKAGESAQCNVTVVPVEYVTITPQGDPITASMGLLVPNGGCGATHPLLSHQHGTNTNDFSGSAAGADIVKAMAKYYASHGYVVVIPDYLGYGASAGLGYHPYLLAETNAATVIDAVRAARNWVAQYGASNGVALNSQLFLDGTSEGGYVTMATQRTMERDFGSEFKLTAVAPTSGPYNLGNTMLDFLQTADTSGNSQTTPATMILVGDHHAYGDVYTAPSEVFQPPWSDTVEGLIPDANYGGDTQLRNACKLPYNLDTNTANPVGPGCASNALLQPAFVAAYMSNTPGTGGAQARAHATANSLLQSWQPVAPMTVCYGSPDPMATPNAVAAAAYFGARADVVDIQGDTSFIGAWMALHADDNGYHGNVEGPGCTAFSRYFVFDPLRI